jgi:eukaryotic-like serine/threonine-protein kinase
VAFGSGQLIPLTADDLRMIGEFRLQALLAAGYVPGPSLHDAVLAGGPLPEAAVWKLMAGLSEALQILHGTGLVHRDLEPGSISLASDGPRVSDFGLTRSQDSTAQASMDSLLHTPPFMSPEQARGEPAGPPSDVFSLGGVSYFAATGRTPFGEANAAVLRFRIGHTEPDLSALQPRMRALVAACMVRDPARRPTPDQLVGALMALVPRSRLPGEYWPEPLAQYIRGYKPPSATAAADLATEAKRGASAGVEAYRPRHRRPAAQSGKGQRRGLASMASAALALVGRKPGRETPVRYETGGLEPGAG